MNGPEDSLVSPTRFEPGAMLAADATARTNDGEESLSETSLKVQRRSILEVKSMLSILVIVLFVITFVVQAFRVPSESMERTLLAGDFLLADKIHLSEGGVWSGLLPYRPIERGDVIVFHYPVEPGTYFVKRVIGVPGDRIRLLNKVVYVNGTPLQENYAIHEPDDHDSYRDNFPSQRNFAASVNQRWRAELQHYLSGTELTVPAGRYFVMGDNRDRSLDSRYWGFVPRDNVMGRPLLIYLSVRGLSDGESGPSDDRLYPSGHLLAHFFQLARWDRVFRLVR